MNSEPTINKKPLVDRVRVTELSDEYKSPLLSDHGNAVAQVRGDGTLDWEGATRYMKDVEVVNLLKR